MAPPVISWFITPYNRYIVSYTIYHYTINQPSFKDGPHPVLNPIQKPYGFCTTTAGALVGVPGRTQDPGPPEAGRAAGGDTAGIGLGRPAGGCGAERRGL